MSDPPLINPNWLTHPVDQAVAIAGYKRAMQLLNTTSLQFVLIQQYFPAASLHVKDSHESILKSIQENFNTVFHPSATCAMGRADDKDAVVDSKARVIGVKRLRVVDASAFPLLSPGHPQATVCKLVPVVLMGVDALAEKIADDIKEAHK
jgi:choline dehydrogenase